MKQRLILIGAGVVVLTVPGQVAAEHDLERTGIFHHVFDETVDVGRQSRGTRHQAAARHLREPLLVQLCHRLAKS